MNLDQLVESYSRKWDETKQDIAASGDANVQAEAENNHQQRHADTEDAIRHVHSTLMAHLNAPPETIEIIRDENGKPSHINKGGRIMTIERGPNGRAMRLT